MIYGLDTIWTQPRTILKIIMISRNMSDQSTEKKIKKWEAKKKSDKIIDVMSAKHTDAEVLQAGLAALAAIGDEDSVNHITHYLDYESPAVRLAACKAGISIGTEYMKTRVQHQLTCEVL